MSTPLPDYKRKALEQRRTDLIEEYEAVNAQLRRTLSAADELKLKRQQRHLEEQIAEVESELGQAPTAPAPSPSTQVAKAGPGSASQPEQLYGAGNRWAVLVGANAYEDAYHFGPLHVSVVDVEATREQLIAGGFDPARIRLLTDNTDEKPTRANILAALKSVADATEPDDLLLFYYSGHGDEAEGQSYLVARDGRHLVLGDTAVPVARVKQIMDAAPARAKVILLDACHSGADIGKKGPQPMTKEFIERVFEQAEGMAILASCKQGQFSYEWGLQEGSVFTHYLLDALKGEADRDGKGFVSVLDASRHVTNGVKLWASQRDVSQTPTLQSAIAGDIILSRYQGPPCVLRTEPPDKTVGVPCNLRTVAITFNRSMKDSWSLDKGCVNAAKDFAWSQKPPTISPDGKTFAFEFRDEGLLPAGTTFEFEVNPAGKPGSGFVDTRDIRATPCKFRFTTDD